MENDFHEIMIQFIESIQEKVGVVEKCILALQNESGSTEALNTLKRELHTIKGTSGSFGLMMGTTISHVFEDFLNSCCEKEDDLSDHVDSFLKYMDLLSEFFEHAKLVDPPDDIAFRNKLDKLIKLDSASEHRVLIVEKTRVVANVYREYFTEKGIFVSIVESGYQALGRILNENFDSIITCLESGEIDGINLVQILEVMKKRPKGVILVTSNQKFEDTEIFDKVFLKSPNITSKIATFYDEKFKL
ncbi:MAG: response regulator [Bacteriovoracaceae bacterium]|nr:response regulator [Bacteriovoracaceae bacterium]